MTQTEILTAQDAARRLGISAKALRLYEARGWVAPLRSAAGWRLYGAKQMQAARKVAALRALGLSLRQVGKVLEGQDCALVHALTERQAALEQEARRVADTARDIAEMRARLEQGARLTLDDLRAPGSMQAVTLALPWPWDGTPFDYPLAPRVTFLTGPLGSGKTRLAKAVAEALQGGFLPLDRPAAPRLQEAAQEALDWICGEGGQDSPALRTLLASLTGNTGPLAIDLIEDGLDPATQTALGSYLTQRYQPEHPLLAMTRSRALLDLEAQPVDAPVLYCPANHAPPFWVTPLPGAHGYDSLLTCLADAATRARVGPLVAQKA